MGQSHDRRRRFDGSRRAQGMSVHGFGRRYGKLLRVLAESHMEGPRLCHIVDRGPGAVLPGGAGYDRG
jgi:hypothetical protein